MVVVLNTLSADSSFVLVRAAFLLPYCVSIVRRRISRMQLGGRSPLYRGRSGGRVIGEVVAIKGRVAKDK